MNGVRRGRRSLGPNSWCCSPLPASLRRPGCAPHRSKETHAGLERFIDEVVRTLHPGGAIGGLRAPVVALDVQAKAAYRAVPFRERLHMTIEARVDAAPAQLGPHVDTLDPPEAAVSPIAPLGGDHQRADDTAARLRDHVERS